MPDSQSSHKQVALVIGAGAVKCAAALGMWQVLNREGIGIDMLVGCSGGSLFATLMALDEDIDTCIKHTQRLWNHQVTRKRHWPSLLRAALPGLLGFDERFGLIDDRVLVARLEEVFADQTFATQNLAHHAEILLVLPEFDRTISLFDTQQFPHVIEQGARAMEAQLPYLHRLLATASREMEVS